LLRRNCLARGRVGSAFFEEKREVSSRSIYIHL
jgi:hypothetical protein